MTTQQVIPHVFEGSTVGTFEKDGIVWFVASDVAKALEYRDANRAIRLLDDYEKDTHIVGTLGGPQLVTVINESGLYHLIFKSRKEAAIRFRKWVTATVLPSIRRNGGYVSGMEKLSPMQQAQTVQLIHEEVQRVAGVNAAEEREARRMGLSAIRGRLQLVTKKTRH